MAAVEVLEVRASVTIAALIYYNALYSGFYFVILVTLASAKLRDFRFRSSMQELLLMPAVVIWALCEIPRFYLGYVGNLSERVPAMSAFLLITVFPTLPCVAFFALGQEFTYPFDAAGGCVMLALLLSELALGYFALKRLITRQTAQFLRLCQAESSADDGAMSPLLAGVS